jgi:hypothetical protein
MYPYRQLQGPALVPPSHTIEAPVISVAIGLQRNNTTSATSSGVPIRICGDLIRERTASSGLPSSNNAFKSGVSMNPGSTAFTLMFCAAFSRPVYMLVDVFTSGKYYSTPATFDNPTPANFEVV